jgi:alanyl-tRNA synthetase
LKNTAELQAVIFFPTVDKLRGGSNSRVYFLAGERALMALNDALDTQKALTGLLRTTPDDHVASVVQLQAELKSSSRTCNVLWKEFAQWKGEALAKVIQECADEQVRLCWIREDANMSVLQSICSVIQDRTSAMDKPWVLITLAGLIKEGGPMLVIASDAATLSEEALKWAEKLNVKGNVNEKLRRWQGKSIESWQHVKKTAKEFGFALVTE